MKKSNIVLLAAISAAFNVSASEDSLVVWNARDSESFKQAVSQFEQDFGITVVLETPSEVEKQFTVVAGAGGGPDIFFFPHDRIGEYVSGGLLAQVQPSPEIQKANLAVGWDAVTHNNQFYAYPISVEAIGLVYNKDLIEVPPETFEELYELKKLLDAQGVETIAWDYNNPYFSYPLFSAKGGYVYGMQDGKPDFSDIGVTNEGFTYGANFIAQAVASGLVAKDTDYGVMDAKFNEGKVAMMINGPWSWANPEKNGINYGVAPLPSLGGETSKPFVGVYSAMINANSDNKEAAVELLENYLLTVEGLSTWNQHGDIGAVTNLEYMEQLKKDPRIAAVALSSSTGMPMPTYPEFSKFWTAVEAATKGFTSGRQSVEEALATADQKLRQ